MSFLKIKGPSELDKLVAEYIKTKNKIQNDFRSERLGEQSMYEDFGKICKPITEQQQTSSKEIVSKFASLQEAIENMPAQQALPWDMPQPEALPDAPAELQALPDTAAVAPAKGQGFLSSDPNALCERLELLMALKLAGNTGLRSEIVSICDELLRQKNLSRDAYKNLMLTLNINVNSKKRI